MKQYAIIKEYIPQPELSQCRMGEGAACVGLSISHGGQDETSSIVAGEQMRKPPKCVVLIVAVHGVSAHGATDGASRDVS